MNDTTSLEEKPLKWIKVGTVFRNTRVNYPCYFVYIKKQGISAYGVNYTDLKNTIYEGDYPDNTRIYYGFSYHYHDLLHDKQFPVVGYIDWKKMWTDHILSAVNGKE